MSSGGARSSLKASDAAASAVSRRQSRSGGGKVRKGRKDRQLLIAGLKRARGHVEAALHAVTLMRKHQGSLDGDAGEKLVHQLRVGCRRAYAAVNAFEPALQQRTTLRVLKSIRKIRRNMARVRDADVMRGLLIWWIENGPKDLRGAHRRVRAELAERRGTMLKPERERLRKAEGRLRKLIEQIGVRIGEIEDGQTQIEGLGEHVKTRIRESTTAVVEAASALGSSDERIHELRIAMKKCRYTLEVFRDWLDDDAGRRLLGKIRRLQNEMGAFNDACVLAAELEGLLKHEQEQGEGRKRRLRDIGKKSRLAGNEIQRLQNAHNEHLARMKSKTLEAWDIFARSAVWREFLARAGVKSTIVKDSSSNPAQLYHLVDRIELNPSLTNRRERQSDGEREKILNGKLTHAKAGVGGRRRVRLAAIDVGTNSLRLIIAEAEAAGAYRVLDDEKETTRLGRGLQTTGRMDPQAIEHSIIAIERMVMIARGYNVDRIQVIGTAACRDADNGQKLIDEILARTGLKMRVISAQEEAQFAYRSAARVFDLSNTPAVVVDIGGGSTEVVLSVGGDKTQGPNGAAQGAGEGVIERIYTIPIGAVRLAERFGDEPRASGKNFEAMVEYARNLVREIVGKVPVLPQVMIGTGGTVTSLGAMMLMQGAGEAESGTGGLFASKVQGAAVRRADLKHLIDRLRKMPLKQRQCVPGLSAERADIIVPGLVLMDALMRRFGCNTLRVHEGGIRDGILRTMAAEEFGRSPDSTSPSARPEAVMRLVRRFARACSYERAHSEHVAALALRIFDQLRSDRAGKKLMLDERDRVLLEAAAVLHDVGYLINYAQHHKHSYHLIIHADLPGLTTREVKVVANVARYHRAAGPKDKHPNFRELDDEDRMRVRALSGILRVADGLDRTHTQGVSSVFVQSRRSTCLIEVESLQEPSVDLWGARKKASVLEEVMGRQIELQWRRIG